MWGNKSHWGVATTAFLSSPPAHCWGSMIYNSENYALIRVKNGVIPIDCQKIGHTSVGWTKVPVFSVVMVGRVSADVDWIVTHRSHIGRFVSHNSSHKVRKSVKPPPCVRLKSHDQVFLYNFLAKMFFELSHQDVFFLLSFLLDGSVWVFQQTNCRSSCSYHTYFFCCKSIDAVFKKFLWNLPRQ